ncbi:hypothetical protein AMAG_05423 [Allomyces macrogynus ATCC 38327]|uniref:Uncharacterized protein n=1 Tax=Allomyces macrogynus (strain ATCC 38327) TaxID=578462 RepID=A0A0L0SC67_ALLM3|nr:hypothetical protein AMAG_05423 [Allomyces macrogynus ATCC 38327]|eukprot:KNE59980.1 hypothetical protein AMAG_05423 [Allomyces macrogynus ATCC 38327]
MHNAWFSSIADAAGAGPIDTTDMLVQSARAHQDSAIWTSAMTVAAGAVFLFLFARRVSLVLFVASLLSYIGYAYF